jgi:hypothetical protein
LATQKPLIEDDLGPINPQYLGLVEVEDPACRVHEPTNS